MVKSPVEELQHLLIGRQWGLYYQEEIKNSIYLSAEECHEMYEPKITKLRGEYSSNASLIFQSCLKDIESPNILEV